MEMRSARSSIQTAFFAVGLLAAAIVICGASLSCRSKEDARPTMMFFSARL
jgi:hypothetical protein